MSQVKALITPKVITWAREQAGYNIVVAADRLKKSMEDIQAWESGSDLPTIAQARELSRLYKRPLAVFYMPEPPADFQTLRDYRKLRTDEERKLSVEIIELIRTVVEQQTWIHDYLLREEEKSLNFIGAAKINNNIYEIADDIRKNLGIDIERQINCSGRYEALKYWLTKAEENRIFIIRKGGIELSECRGFVISDKIAPFIYLNSEDALAAQLFTLAHELAHLWINESGISNLEIVGTFKSGHESKVEEFCNSIASETIMPNKKFIEIFDKIDKRKEIEEMIENLSNKFKVSEEAVARRLFNLNKISKETYEKLREFYKKRWLELKETEKKKLKEREGGPSYYTKMVTWNGLAFTQVVMGAYSGEKITGRDASVLLNVKINNFKKLSDKVNSIFSSRINMITLNG